MQFSATKEKTLEEEACHFYQIHQKTKVSKRGGKHTQIGKKLIINYTKNDIINCMRQFNNVT
jgi:hypothetical protein